LERITELIDSTLDSASPEKEPELIMTADMFRRALRGITGTLAEGFVFPAGNITVFTEHQIFSRHRAGISRRKSVKAAGLRDLSQLRRGDYVDHSDKGIAIYDGMETILVGGEKQECVRLIFNGGDKMFLHVNYINRLQKYSAQDAQPVL